MTDYKKLQYAEFAFCRLKINFPLLYSSFTQFSVVSNAFQCIYILFAETYTDLEINSKKRIS